MHKIYLMINFIIILCSCHRPFKNEIVYSRDYAITIETRECISGGRIIRALIYNIPQYHLKNYAVFKPHHLYLIRQDLKNDTFISEMCELELTSEIEDSIYYFVHKYLMDFSIDNKNVFVNGKFVEEDIEDGACLSVQLEYKKKMIRCEQYNLEGIEHASPEIKKLLSIINCRVQEKFRLH